MSAMAMNGEMNGAARTVRALSASSGFELKDAALLERFLQEQDNESFAALVKRHGPLVRSVCARFLLDRRDIEDVFQATFIVLASRAQTIRKMDSIASWLYGVALRLARKVQVRGSRRKQHEQRAAMRRRDETPPPDAGWREVCSILYEELNRLPERQRAPLLLCYWEGMTQDEAAHQLSLPRGTLKRRLETGRNKLRDRLASRGLGLSAVLLALMLSERKLFAHVPPTLVQRTVRTATAGRFAVGSTGAVSLRAALLAGSMSSLTLGFTLKAIVGILIVSGALAVPVYNNLSAAASALDSGARTGAMRATSIPPPPNKSESVHTAPAAPGDMPVRRAPLAVSHPNSVM
jgi:RNA polymerase sigma factor (sigma-70 family)